MKKILLIIVAGLMVQITNGADNQPAKKIFHASFDRFHADADLAKGNPKSTLKANLELRATKGIRKSGLLLEKGERCGYDIKGNLNLAAATVSMWVCPVNWSWQDHRYYYLLTAASGKDQKFRFQVYVPGSYTGGGGVGFYCQFGKRKTPGFKAISLLAPLKWKPGEWHKVDVAWDSSMIKLYIDGQLKGTKALSDEKFPPLTGNKFYINRVNRGPKKKHLSPDDRSVMDEVIIYDGVLSSEQIMKNYAADQALLSGKMNRPETIVPLTTGKIKLDGKLNDKQWAKATVIPIRVKHDTFASNNISKAYLLWDRQNLYLGFRSKFLNGKPPVAKQTSRDGKLWEDDSFELFIWPGRETKEFYQFIVNAKGAVYDAAGKDKRWNAKLTSKGYIGKDYWSVEMALPLSDFPGKIANGSTWKANLCRNWFRAKPHRPIFTSWASFTNGYQSGYGLLNFSKRSAGVELSLGAALGTGTMQVECQNPGNSAVACSWQVKSSHKPQLDGEMQVISRNKKRQTVLLSGFKDSTVNVKVTDNKSGKLLMLYPAHFFVKEPVEVEYIPYVLEKKLTLEVDLSNLPENFMTAINRQKVKMQITAIGPKGGKSTKSFKVSKIKGDYTIPINWADGKYTFNYQVSAPGMTTVNAKSYLVKPPTPWLTTKTGITDQVLTPWTPLKYHKDGSISVWNRTYTLDGPFPAKIINRGKNILTGPVKLTMTTDQGSATFKVTNEKRVMNKPHRAEFAGTAKFGNLGGSAKFTTFLEYDGLTATKLTLTPPAGGWNIKSMTMTIPLRPDLAKAIRKPKRINWNGKLWQSSFEPYIWIGNGNEGFDWFFNSDANWNYADNQKPTIISVDKQRALVTLKIVMKPGKVTQPMHYTFGFQATPVRSFVKNWRRVNNMTRDWKRRTMNNWNVSYATQQSLLIAERPEAARQYYKKKFTDKGIKVYLYAGACSTAAPNPTFEFFRKKWSNPFGSTFYNQNTRKSAMHPGSKVPYTIQPISQNSSYADYMMWTGARLLKQLNLNNIYTDMDRLLPDNNKYHGSGYHNDAFGRSGVTYDILPRRSFYKRLLTICRNAPIVLGQQGERFNHAHDAMVLPYHAFNDYFYPGEQFSHNLYRNDWFYINDLDPKAWRYELSGRTSGLSHVFLPQFVRGSKKKSDWDRPELADSLNTLGLLNDVVISGSYSKRSAVEEYWRLRDESGITAPSTTSICYWEKHCPVKAETAKSEASVYITPQGIAVGVGNLMGKARSITVKFDAKALKLKGKVKAIDLRSGKKLTVTGNKFTVPVKSRNYTIVRLAPYL
jgi:Concanavalin A-like lectin/glucanases superfamily/Glycoside hydrolase 123, N-terminal domain/Carbohydrate family 9 binding domain-like